ncbi:p24 complex component [Malassezia cuniculi]|uniref:P24 complex component n=1 Tax=Malassezia cuniculi TaxID=948313 RepID=A0AAF0J9T3_9BASI|nr:p24 complex component [Malassezia cuniculi]
MAMVLKLFWVALLAALALLQTAAHTIDLAAHEERCFFEDMHVGDEMTLTFQVGGGGHLDIDTRLTDPDGQLLYQLLRHDTGTYEFVAEKDGRYTYCFGNNFSTVSHKTVSFNVHGVLYLADDEGLMPAEHELRELAANIQLFKDEQEYLVMRERIHRNTAESTNTRVKWWSVLQTVLVVLVCAFQVYFVKRQFEVRRAV